MVDVYKSNVDYMKDRFELFDIDERNITKILNSSAIPNSYIYDFEDIELEFGFKEFNLHDIYHCEKIHQPVYIYQLDNGYDDEAFTAQLYNIPDCDEWTDVRFCVFLAPEIINDKVMYNSILGHELSHIDLLHLPVYVNHPFQRRYILTEVYCDIKALERIEDEQLKLNAYNHMICGWKKDMKEVYFVDKDLIREFEVRIKFAKLYNKGKITSEGVYRYIINNYERHMEFLSCMKKKYEQVANQFELKCLDHESSLEAINKKHKIKNNIMNQFYI